MPPDVATIVVKGPPVVGKLTGSVRAYRLNCFPPPHRFVRSVVVLTTPAVVYVDTEPEHQCVHALVPIRLVTALPAKFQLAPP